VFDTKGIGCEHGEGGVSAGNVAVPERDQQGAVGVHADVGRTRFDTTRPAADCDTDAPGRIGATLLPERVILQGFQDFPETNAWPWLAIGHQVAFLGRIPEPELERVPADLLGNLINGLLD